MNFTAEALLEEAVTRSIPLIADTLVNPIIIMHNMKIIF
jgi:hypothetical protein